MNFFDKDTNSSSKDQPSIENENHSSSEDTQSVEASINTIAEEFSDDMNYNASHICTPDIVGQGLCSESSNKPKRQTNFEHSMRGRNLFDDLDNVADKRKTITDAEKNSNELRINSEQLSIKTDRWSDYVGDLPHQELSNNSKGSQGRHGGTESINEISFFSTSHVGSGIDIYRNREHGGLHVQCSEDSRGQIFPKRSNPGHLTATLPGYPEEHGPSMDTPFVVDADGYIMFVDMVPNLWNEIEGNRPDFVTYEDDVEHFDYELAKLDMEPISLNDLKVHDEYRCEDNDDETDDFHVGIDNNKRQMPIEVPSRVQRIKKRRDLQVRPQILFFSVYQRTIQ